MANNDIIIRARLTDETPAQEDKARAEKSIRAWFEEKGLIAENIRAAYSMPEVTITCSQEAAKAFQQAVNEGLEGISACKLFANVQFQPCTPPTQKEWTERSTPTNNKGPRGI